MVGQNQNCPERSRSKIYSGRSFGMMQEKKQKQILLVGNPNVGKSTLFNVLCNRKQKTGNYAGVTVASHSGNYIYKNEEIEVIDLPGSYSIYPTSEDEAIFSRYLIQEDYSGVVYIADAINMRRSLLLFQQIQDLGIPAILVVNQVDEAEKRGIKIDISKLSEILNIPVFETNAKNNVGIETVRKRFLIMNSKLRRLILSKFLWSKKLWFIRFHQIRQKRIFTRSGHF
jgi:ferrous iron transport protein B